MRTGETLCAFFCVREYAKGKTNMKVEYQTLAAGGRLTLAGELDHHAAKSAMSAIEREIDVYMPRDCILDLAELTFMDSSGIAVILRTLRRMNEVGGRIRVENVRTQPMRVIDAAGIERIIIVSAAAG